MKLISSLKVLTYILCYLSNDKLSNTCQWRLIYPSRGRNSNWRWFSPPRPSAHALTYFSSTYQLVRAQSGKSGCGSLFDSLNEFWTIKRLRLCFDLWRDVFTSVDWVSGKSVRENNTACSTFFPLNFSSRVTLMSEAVCDEVIFPCFTFYKTIIVLRQEIILCAKSLSLYNGFDLCFINELLSEFIVNTQKTLFFVDTF